MSINPNDLSKIIRACRKAGVSSLRLGELEIKFQTGDAAEVLVPAGETVEPPNEKELRALEESSRTEDALNTADEELAYMQVENPALFEEMLIQRELEPSGDDGRDSESFEAAD